MQVFRCVGLREFHCMIKKFREPDASEKTLHHSINPLV
jgi:hypothetical protein